MSRYDDNWNRDFHRVGRHWTAFEQPGRRDMAEKGARGGHLFTLGVLVMVSTAAVVTLNLLGYRLM